MFIPWLHDAGIYSPSSGGLQAPMVWERQYYYVDRCSVAGLHSSNVFVFDVALS